MTFFLILLFSKNDQILNSKHMTCVIYIYQIIWPVKYTSLINSIIPEPNVIFFLSYDIRTMKTHSLQKKLWFCHYVRNDIMDVHNVIRKSVNHKWFIDYNAWRYFTPRRDVI